MKVFSLNVPLTRPDYLDLLAERAAIMEHDGGMTPEDARKGALQDTFRVFGPCPREAA